MNSTKDRPDLDALLTEDFKDSDSDLFDGAAELLARVREREMKLAEEGVSKNDAKEKKKKPGEAKSKDDKRVLQKFYILMTPDESQMLARLKLKYTRTEAFHDVIVAQMKKLLASPEFTDYIKELLTYSPA